MKQLKVKPSLYAYYFEILKRIALTYGYNLVLHGSLDSDLDLIAIPWEEEIGSYRQMVANFCRVLGIKKDDVHVVYTKKPHGRQCCIIDLNRTHWTGYDAQYYIDLSIMPTIGGAK
jgi:hypothetical protein